MNKAKAGIEGGNDKQKLIKVKGIAQKMTRESWLRMKAEGYRLMAEASARNKKAQRTAFGP